MSDTSKAAEVPIGGVYRWADLSPFAQGYVTAMLADCAALVADDDDSGEYWIPRFSAIAAVTLSIVVRDCAEAESWGAADYMHDAYMKCRAGASYWRRRQRGSVSYRGHHHIAPYVSDDGKLRFLEPVK